MARAIIGSGNQISMNLVRLTIPSPAFAWRLGGGHASGTRHCHGNNKHQRSHPTFPRSRKYRRQFLTARESTMENIPQFKANAACSTGDRWND
jgi:hypothetical protein